MKEKSAKNRIIIVLLLFAIAGVISFILFLLFMNSDEQRIKRQLSLGEKYLDEMDYENAILAYNMAIAIDPNSAESYVGLAEAYAGIEDYDKSLDTIKAGMDVVGEKRELLEQRGKTIELYLGVGDECYQLKKYDEAIEIFNKIIEADPQTTDAYIGIANAYIEKGMYEEALEAVNKGIEINGEIDGLVELRKKISEILSSEEKTNEESSEEDTIEEEQFSQEYRELYAEFLRGQEKINNVGDPVRFELVYIDEDDIPELAIAEWYGHPEKVNLYTISSGKIVNLGEYGECGWMEYVDHGNMIHGVNSGMGIYEDYYITFDNLEEKIVLQLFQNVNNPSGDIFSVGDQDVAQKAYEEEKAKMSGNYKMCTYDDYYDEEDNVTSRTMYDINEENISKYLFGTDDFEANDESKGNSESSAVSDEGKNTFTESVRVRSSPDKADNSNVIAKAAANDIYERVGEYGQWTKIKYKDTVAYVETKFVVDVN